MPPANDQSSGVLAGNNPIRRSMIKPAQPRAVVSISNGDFEFQKVSFFALQLETAQKHEDVDPQGTIGSCVPDLGR